MPMGALSSDEEADDNPAVEAYLRKKETYAGVQG